MIRLYASGGSQEIDLINQRIRPEVWGRLRETAARLLSRRVLMVCWQDRGADWYCRRSVRNYKASGVAGV